MTPAIRRTSVTESQPLGSMLIPYPLSPLPRRAAGAAHVVRSRRRIAGGGPLDDPLGPLPRRAAVSAHQVRTKSRIAGGGPLDDPLGPLPRRAAVFAHPVRTQSRIAGGGPPAEPPRPPPRTPAVSAHQVRTKSRIAGGGPLDDPLGPLPRRAAVFAHAVRSRRRIAGGGRGEELFRFFAPRLGGFAEIGPAPIVFDDARISPEVSDEIACPGYVETVRAIHNILRGRECRLRKASSQRPC